jgi:hypothetical protein
MLHPSQQAPAPAKAKVLPAWIREGLIKAEQRQVEEKRRAAGGTGAGAGGAMGEGQLYLGQQRVRSSPPSPSVRQAAFIYGQLCVEGGN